VHNNKTVYIIAFGYCDRSELEGDVWTLGACRLTAHINFRGSKGLPPVTGWKIDWWPTATVRRWTR
jgi:hypothetical protein